MIRVNHRGEIILMSFDLNAPIPLAIDEIGEIRDEEKYTLVEIKPENRLYKVLNRSYQIRNAIFYNGYSLPD